jgi:hypothetical protein
MFEVTRVLHAAEGMNPSVWDTTVEAMVTSAKSSRALNWLVAPTSDGTINGGDLIVRLRFDDESIADRTAHKLHRIAEASSAVERVHGADYRSIDTDRTHFGSNATEATAGIYRALLIKVSPDAEPALIERFERDLLSMPKYLPSIVRWRLSTVSKAFGQTAWTHVWEQEFTDVDGLLGEYMDHPVHWGIVDRWFDPECPEMIVHDRVCHTFCAIDAPILDSSTASRPHRTLVGEDRSVALRSR